MIPQSALDTLNRETFAKKHIHQLVTLWHDSSYPAWCRVFCHPSRLRRVDGRWDSIGTPQSIIDLQAFVSSIDSKEDEALSPGYIKTLYLLDVFRTYRNSSTTQNDASNSSRIYSAIRNNSAYQGYLQQLQLLPDKMMSQAMQLREKLRDAEKALRQERVCCQSHLNLIYVDLELGLERGRELSRAEKSALLDLAHKSNFISKEKHFLYQAAEGVSLGALLQSFQLSADDQETLLRKFSEKQEPSLVRAKDRVKVMRQMVKEVDFKIAQMPLIEKKYQVKLLIQKFPDLSDRRWLLEKYVEETITKPKVSELTDLDRARAIIALDKLPELAPADKTRLWRIQHVEISSLIVSKRKSLYRSAESPVSLSVSWITLAITWVREHANAATQDAFVTAFEEAKDRGLEEKFFQQLADDRLGGCVATRVDRAIRFGAELWKQAGYPRKAAEAVGVFPVVVSEDSLVSMSSSVSSVGSYRPDSPSPSPSGEQSLYATVQF